MFREVTAAPADPILGLSEAFREDPRSGKVNLGVGVYKDENGTTPVLETVKEAEGRILAAETSKAYKPIAGDPAFAEQLAPMILGPDHPALAADRVRTAHTAGGTAALRVAAELLRAVGPGGAPPVWLSDPSWANHGAVLEAAGLPVRRYPYYDAEACALDLDAMTETLAGVGPGEAVLLHACCHNPTGVDPSPEQWARLGDLLAERGALPIVDFAYQGLGDGIAEDAAGVRALARRVPELLVASSQSKNFGLYNERTGSLSVVAESPERAEAVFSRVKPCIRACYSNPPAHGGAIVETILGDPDRKARWEAEVAGMRDRIRSLRGRFARALAERAPDRDFSFIERQRGMFSYIGLGAEQARALRERHAIYMLESGRINVAGMSSSNVEPIADAVASVL